MSDIDLKNIDLAGVGVPVARAGESDAPLLVILHGGGGPVHGLPVWSRLAERFQLLAPVHPGFAGTPIPEHFDGLDDLVYLYLDLFDALGLRDVHLMGLSFGGWLAAEVAVRNTSHIARLTLVDAVGIKPGDRDTRDIADVFALPHDQLLARLYHDVSRAPDMSSASEDDWARIAADRTALALYTWEPYMHNPKLAGRLHRVDRPTRLIWGESDGVVSVDYARAFEKCLPEADLVIIERAGHLPHVEQPERFVKAVSDFAGL